MVATTRYLAAAVLFGGMVVGVWESAKAQPNPAPEGKAAKKQEAKPAPDVIVFTNGDQLTGQLVRGVGESIVFRSDMAGEITVPLSRVQELRSTGSFAVLRKDQKVTRVSIHPGTILYGDNNITVANPDGPPDTIPVKQISYIIDQTTYDRDLERRPGAFSGWSGTITAGATLVRSTQNGSSFTTGISMVRATPTVTFLPKRNRTSFNVRETYGKLTQPVIPQTDPPSPDIVATTSIFHGDGERDEYFSPHFYGLAQTAFDHNYSQGLNLQQIFGGGIGWTAISNPKQELDLKSDVHYEKQNFETVTSNEELFGSTISEAYKRNLPRKLVLTQTLNVLPAWNQFHAFSANGSVEMALPLFRRFATTFTASDSFLNNPAAGFRKNSFQFVSGLSYSLR
jgi:hypothetical protein